MGGGIARTEIDQRLLGLKLDTSHINSLEVAKSVVLENAAGVIDEADYLSWPETGGGLVLLNPSRQQVRVIGRTIRIPQGPFVASLETPAELRTKVRKYLLEEVSRQPIILSILGIKGFAGPIDPAEYEPYFEMRRKLFDSPIQPVLD